MAQRHKIPEFDQDTLFSLDPIDPRPPKVEPGISVNLKDRAVHLGHVLDILGSAHRLDGLLKASDPELNSSNRHALERRYGTTNLDSMRQAGPARADRQLYDANWQFEYATGWMAVKHSGLISEPVREQMAREDFKAFDRTYFGGQQATNARSRLRRQLEKQQK